MSGISLTPNGSETLNLTGGGSNDGSGFRAGSGFVGGAILGGGAGYILSREVGDMKGKMGELAAEIKGSQSSIEKEVGNVTMNLKDQICGTEKLIASESQRTNATIGAVNDVMAARMNNLDKSIMQNNYDRLLADKDIQKQIDDCCCRMNVRLTELECCCNNTREKLSTQMACMQNDLENKMLLQTKDTEIQRLRDQAELNERFCKLEKGQEAILAKLEMDSKIEFAKKEAVEKFKIDQIYNKYIGSNPQ